MKTEIFERLNRREGDVYVCFHRISALMYLGFGEGKSLHKLIKKATKLVMEDRINNLPSSPQTDATWHKGADLDYSWYGESRGKYNLLTRTDSV